MIELKDVIGFEDLYKIDERGKLHSNPRQGTKGKIIKGSITKHGYLRYGLKTKNKKQVNRFAHVLVAMAFIPNPDNLKEVNHEDGDKLNNSVTNLKWCTRSYNVKHAYDTGIKQANPRLGEAHPGSKLNNETVMLIRNEYKGKNTSHQKLGIKYGVSAGVIGRIVNNKSWKHILSECIE